MAGASRSLRSDGDWTISNVKWARSNVRFGIIYSSQLASNFAYVGEIIKILCTIIVDS